MPFARLEIQVKGEDAVARALDKYGERAEGLITEVLAENARRIAQQAKNKAPRGRTGRLKRSIRGGTVKRAGPMVASVKATAPYAAYQEFGTGRGARAYVPTLPTEIQRIARSFQRPPTPKNPNITPKKFLWNSVVAGLPVIKRTINQTLKQLEL